MAQYLKYEWTDTQKASALAKITETVTDHEGNESTKWTDNVLAVVDLGKLVKTPAVLEAPTGDSGGEWNEVSPAVYATKNSVDILWADQPDASITGVVWPEPGTEAHVFGGWEVEYARAYCEANPSAAYCQAPEPIDPLN